MVKVGNSNTLPFKSMCWASELRGLVSAAGDDVADAAAAAISLNLYGSFRSNLGRREGGRREEKAKRDDGKMMFRRWERRRGRKDLLNLSQKSHCPAQHGSQTSTLSGHGPQPGGALSSLGGLALGNTVETSLLVVKRRHLWRMFYHHGVLVAPSLLVGFL
jgi:hypothetical protein